MEVENVVCFRGTRCSRNSRNESGDVGSTITEANAAAATPTTGILAAGADEVSAAVAAVFGAHAEGYQILSTQAAAFHQQFVQA